MELWILSYLQFQSFARNLGQLITVIIAHKYNVVSQSIIYAARVEN